MRELPKNAIKLVVKDILVGTMAYNKEISYKSYAGKVKVMISLTLGGKTYDTNVEKGPEGLIITLGEEPKPGPEEPEPGPEEPKPGPEEPEPGPEEPKPGPEEPKPDTKKK